MARRAWDLGADAPLALQIAADARFASTDYADDQVWELGLGGVGRPALECFTRYGGRVGRLSIVPTWWIDGRPVYEYQAYSSPPKVIAFAPGYVLVEAYISRDLKLQAEYRALDSHALGVRYLFRNDADTPQKLTLDVVAFAAAQGVEKKTTLLRSMFEDNASLSFGEFGNISPLLMLESGAASEGTQKLSSVIVVPAKGLGKVRAVVAALNDRNASRDAASSWLKAEWAKPILSGAAAQEAIPMIETGDRDLDAVLAFSYQQALGAFLKPSAALPNPSFVANRQPDAGFRPVGTAVSSSITPRTRGGQNPALAYLLALAVVPMQPDFAKGIILNYLAVQKADGWIDWSPGLDGMGRGLLCLPILARMAWGIYQFTGDVAFLKQAYPGLNKFLNRWLAADLDVDKDGVPEWQAEAQAAYPFLPIFSRGLPYGQNADIRLIESPDLLAYLLSEAISLREMALMLGLDADVQALAAQIEKLQTGLESLWHDDVQRYAHRDRDTHATAQSEMVVKDMPANEAFGGQALTTPTRLILDVVGGTSRPKLMKLSLEGIALDGTTIRETANSDDFAWTAGRGSYTSQHAFTRIERIACEGLIPSYKISARTLDTSQIDITALLPLWAVDIPAEHAHAIVALIKNPEHFWRKYGTVMLSAADPHYQPEQIEFAAGVWGFWLTLLGEGLIEAGETAAAAELLKRFFAGMIPVVKGDKAFYEGYNAEKVAGIGTRGHVGGIAPLHLFLRVIGVRIVSPQSVWTGEAFVWDQPVTVTHQGVSVRRSATGTTVTFPSGEVVTLAPDAVWQQVTSRKDSA